MRTPSVHPARRPAAAAGARVRGRGFTLVELMVALTGGLFFSIFVFMLARDSSRFYQRESRLGDATLSAINGFQRLRSDVARAGYLASPNLRRDSNFCGNLSAGGWAANPRLASLAPLRVDPGTGIEQELTDNGLAPVDLHLMGSYSSPDQFSIRAVNPVSGGVQVYLQVDTPAMRRLGYSTATPTPFTDLFLPGRVLRIVDKAGSIQFGLITSANASTPTEPTIVLANAPGLVFREGSVGCGLRGLETGSLVNVVQHIRYRIVRDAAFDALYTGNFNTEFDALHTELIREEVTWANAPVLLTGTQPELVAEFAVDLGVDLLVSNTTNGATTYVASSDASFVNYAGDPLSAAANQGPELVRAVRTRLSVRSRMPDRGAELPASADVATGLYRFELGADSGSFTRVRTLQADIALRNHENARW